MTRHTESNKRQGYTAADKRVIKLHLNELRQLGCIACWSQGQKNQCQHTPYPSRTRAISTKQRPPYDRPVLCHHQSEAKGDTSIHGSSALFKAQFGTELDLLAHTFNQLYPDGIFPSTYTPPVNAQLSSYRPVLEIVP